jgi:hypothetical protein
MTISALNSYAAFTLSTDNASSAVSAGRKDKTEETIPESGNTSSQSAPVTLSKEAQGFAELASKGITSFTIYDGRRAMQELLNGTRGAGSALPSGLGGAISASDFDQVMSHLGATQAQTDGLRQGFDSDGDGSITNDEMLRGIADLGARSNNSNSQLLLGLMDRSGNSDGVVQQGEFMGVETSLVYALKKS